MQTLRDRVRGFRRVRAGVAGLVIALTAAPAVAQATDGAQRGERAGAGESDHPAGSATAAGPAEGLPALDVRSRAAEQPADPAGTPAARAALLDSLGLQGVFEADPVTGTPRVVARLDGFLTPPSGADPAAIALGYVREHAAAFGLEPADLATLRLSRDYTDVEGTTHLAWAQVAGGIEVFENGLIANVAEDGRLINVMGSPVPGIDRLRTPEPELGAAEALARARSNAGARGPLPALRDRSGAADRLTRFAGGDQARLVLFAAPDGVQLAWRVSANVSSTERYDYAIDASTGDVLVRENTVDFLSAQVWQYAPQIHQVCPECSAPAGTQSATAMPSDWFETAGPSNLQQGAYARVYTDVDDNNSPDSPFANCPECGSIPASSGGGTAAAAWHYAFVANPRAASGHLSDNCFTIFPQCSWSVTTNPSFDFGFGWRDNLRQNGTQVFYYVNRFHDWLEAAPFGFTSAAGNFEGVDAVNAEILDGANSDTSAGAIPGTPDLQHVNNANMSTPADGSPPRMQMYLFLELGGGSVPESNGGDDASVIYHEYVHGLSNRLVLDAQGNPALRSHQARSMGEGWSDWYALDFLEGSDYDETDTTTDHGEMNMGVYVQGGDIHSLRTEGLDCIRGSGTDPDCPGTTGAGSGGYTLGDMGRVVGQPEVHADGEIWAQALWDLRQRFVTDLGGGTFNGAGITAVRNLITRGMELAPPDPSFLEMRNAILQADKTIYGGANRNRIWAVFARRGMGFFATDEGSADTRPRQDFERPPKCKFIDCGSLTGVVRERASNNPVANALVEVVGPGTLSDRTDANGVYVIDDVPPHVYRFVEASKAGYRPTTAKNVTVGTGASSLNFKIYRDWLAVNAGGQVTAFSPPDFSGFGCGPAAGFDTSLASGWGSSNIAPQDPSLPGGAKSATVQLPRSIDVTRFAVDPGATCGDDDSASTERLRIETSANGTSFTTVGTFIYSAADNHRLNEFAPAAPIPGVTHVRVTMLQRQGGGQSGLNFMDLSEVQAYGEP
jgi:extracellular elastinolytic metalloproteinase